MEKLKPITYDSDLSEFALDRTPFDNDRLTTTLKLEDYSWMDYELSSFFPTKKYGDLDIKFEYYGATKSTLEIEQKIDGNIYSHCIDFDSEIYKKYLVMFMEQHIAHWQSEYAFCGEKIVLDFFNEVLENYIEYEIYSGDDDDDAPAN